MDRTDETTTSTGLRPIERLDQAKIDRIVAGCSDRLRTNDANKWDMGDAILAELPVEWVGNMRAIAARNRYQQPEKEAERRRYLQAAAERLGANVGQLQQFRYCSAAWKPADRYEGASWNLHNQLRIHPDRDELIRLPLADVQRALHQGKPSSVPRDRDKDRSFSNISKAAEAAIEVLADEDISADKRVAIALNILVKFFEEAAAA